MGGQFEPWVPEKKFLTSQPFTHFRHLLEGHILRVAAPISANLRSRFYGTDLCLMNAYL